MLIKKNLTDYVAYDKVYEYLETIENLLSPDNRLYGYSYDSLRLNSHTGCLMALFISDRVPVPLYVKVGGGHTNEQTERST